MIPMTAEIPQPSVPSHDGCSHEPASPSLLEAVMDYAAKSPKWNQFQLAVTERRIWDEASAAHRKEFLKGEFVAHFTGAKSYEVDARGRLLNGGTVADPLWTRVNKGEMPLGTAVQLLAKGRKRANEAGVNAAAAVAAILAEYETQGYTTKMPDGKVFRRKAPSAIPRPVPQSFKKAKKARKDDASGRAVWQQIREALASLVHDRLEDAEPVMQDKLIGEFERDLKVMLDQLQQKLYRMSVQAKANAPFTTRGISRRALVEACRTLHMDPPPVGALVDEKQAKKQKHKLAAVYHPDAHGGDETTRPQYEAVLAAYTEVEKYNEQVGQVS